MKHNGIPKRPGGGGTAVLNRAGPGRHAGTTSSNRTANTPVSALGSAGTAPTHDGAVTILLVDDDPDCRLLIRDTIRESKCTNRVYEVANGQEALDFLAHRGPHADAPRPGLIFLDIEMPVMDGLETLARIRADEHLKDIPVVIMTGVCDESQMQQAAALGANSYTIKPANAEQFLRTVLASTSYWLTIHQYPFHHVPPEECKR